MAFNFENIGDPIAKIYGGIKDKEKLYLAPPSEVKNVKNPIYEIKLDKSATFQPIPRKYIVEKVFAPSN